MLDEDQNLDAPEPQVEDSVEAEVPEDEEAPDDADSDEADDAGDEGDDEQGSGEPQTTPSRANTRIRALNSSKKEALARAEKAERETAELRRQMEEVQRSLRTNNAVKDAAAEAELLEQMDPVQRVAYEADKKIAALNADLHRVKLASLDSQDKAEFLTKYQGDAALKRLLPEVEKNLAAMRANGLNVPREELYALALGKDLLAQKAKTGKSNPDKQAAQARVSSTQGRPTSARGDSGPSGRKGQTAEQRLENVIL